MAVRHRLIKRPVADVWSVLSDPFRFADWVVGTAHSKPREGSWPDVGSSVTYTIRLARWSVQGWTAVRRREEPEVLELEANSGPLGSARIAIEVRSWGEDALVIVDEHPLTGPGRKLHNKAVDALIQLRHRTMLARLADVVESSTPQSIGSS
ncbi:Polyketide cyclase / dehydrase and lipid transport [Streptomyces sp. YIM 130001]|uniref:SRPBCC family protein n=1 Tax=Streptomyces sp. YIM 130001 TaxID=2259644 RepID=UPI000E64B050|nr:SRPBCC family protein [Streptomyces sp. YIM 130001]RII20451.1 Polyketide cyclase / dehydrase and lipid transport [Streptomyces sp. YIM 130001]